MMMNLPFIIHDKFYLFQSNYSVTCPILDKRIYVIVYGANFPHTDKFISPSLSVLIY